MRGSLITYKTTGTEDPFNARMMFGIFHLRDKLVKNEEERLAFDALYSPVLENLDECLQNKKQLMDLITNHKRKIKTKEIVGFQNNGEILEIHESIDREMNRLFKDFFIKGEIALKASQKLYKKYGLEIGFFFQDDKAFKKGVEMFLKEAKPDSKGIIEMLTKDRRWHSLFNQIRIDIEHGGLSLGGVKYRHDAEGNVSAHFPTINGKELEEVLSILSTNVFEFIEDLIAMTVNRNLKPPLSVVQIPVDKRDPSWPIKYKVTIDGLPVY